MRKAKDSTQPQNSAIFVQLGSAPAYGNLKRAYFYSVPNPARDQDAPILMNCKHYNGTIFILTFVPDRSHSVAIRCVSFLMQKARDVGIFLLICIQDFLILLLAHCAAVPAAHNS